MEFLNISLTKDSSLLLHVIHSPFYCRILKKTIRYSGFKNTYKKIPETRELESIHEQHFVERKNEGRKLETRVYAQKTRLKNAVQEFHLSMHRFDLKWHLSSCPRSGEERRPPSPC